MLEIVVMIEETSGIWAITCRPMIGAPPGTDRNAAPALGAASLAQAEDQLTCGPLGGGSSVGRADVCARVRAPPVESSPAGRTHLKEERDA